jgi:ribosomal protein S27AE
MCPKCGENLENMLKPENITKEIICPNCGAVLVIDFGSGW